MILRIVSAALVLAALEPAFSAEPPALIPRSVLFCSAEPANPQVSPDGRTIAWIAPDKNNVAQIWVRGAGDAEARQVTLDARRGIRRYFWTHRPNELIFLQDRDGDENVHLHQVNIKTAATRNLTPFDGCRAQVIGVDPGYPNEALVALNLRSKSRFDVYRINLETAVAHLDTENPGQVFSWLPDAQFKVRAGIAGNAKGGADLLFRASVKDKFQMLRSWDVGDEGTPVGFSRDGKTLFLQANHDANVLRLIAVNLATGKERVLAEDPTYDLAGVFFHPTRRTVQAAGFLRDKLYWEALDAGIKGDLDVLTKARPGQLNMVSRDLKDETWIVSYSRDDGPTTYALYRRGLKDKPLEVLFDGPQELEKWPLAKMTPILFKARDGLAIHGYLTLPIGVKAKSLPTVLLVHGGPWSRDAWGYNAKVQWLANRGYAVLQVNFRGSSGYGKKFLAAGDKEWGGKMQEDLIDAVKWLTDSGVADAKRVAIMGTSYGGYATLAGLAFTPDTFCCGVAIVGPSNIVSLLRAIPPYWAPMKAMFARRVGDVDKEEAFLKSRSPLFAVDRIKSPLLIAQGANDPRVNQAESDQIVAALRKAGKSVEYLLYTDEGHGFHRPENQLHFYSHAERFLARRLGGRIEAGDEVKGHSGVVK